MNIASLSDDNLTRFGDYDAVLDDGGAWRASVLHDQASCLAGALSETGIAAGERVLLLLPNCAQLVVSFTSALRCGGVAVPLFVGTSAAELARIVAHCTPSLVIAHDSRVADVTPVTASVPFRVWVGHGRPAPQGWHSFASLLAHAPLHEAVACDATDVAQLSYTTGTTGAPRGVVYTHGSVRARVSVLSAQHDQAIIPVVFPLNSVGAGLLTQRLSRKWTLLLAEKFEPAAFLASIGRARATTLLLVPSVCETLLAVFDSRVHDVSSLREIDITGAPASESLVERMTQAFGVSPRLRYGMTEAGGGIAATSAGSRPKSVGRALPNVELRIVDEQGRPTLPGEVGEIRVKTPWMAAAYYGAPDQTAATFQDGWLRTGDLGFVSSDLDLFLVGRRSEMLIQGGVNVHPAEVSEVVETIPDVTECAVVGVPHELLGEEAVACVVRHPASRLTADDVIAHCRQRLDHRKLPVRVHFVAALPKTFNGKVNTLGLRQLVTQRDGAVETETFRRLIEKTTAERATALRELIDSLVRHLTDVGAPSTDPAATFGDMGLTSLGAMQLSARLSEAFGRKLPAVLPFTYPSVPALAQHLEALLFGAGAPRGLVSTPRDERGAGDDIALVGLGCRFPAGVEAPEQFWELLRLEVSTCANWPRQRLDPGHDEGERVGSCPPRGSFLERADLFDAAFFHLGAQAESIDPQHRLLMETTWEAFEHAGCNPLALDGTRVGVFLGSSGTSYRSSDNLGVAPSMAIGRLCHFFDFRGPAVTIDTSCSSGLVALHSAAQSLRRGECDLAVVAGSKVIANRAALHGLRLDVIAPDGCSKAFDARADGYGRGEGAVALVLTRVADARAAGRRIHAVVRGSAMNHDGRSSSLTAPNPQAQEAVIREALAAAGVTPDDIQYVETHGTGTLLGDPIEVQALAAVFRERSAPLAIGSVKTNVGHLEAAAGLVGVLKTTLAMTHRTLPASLYFKNGNPHIPWAEIPIVVQARTGAWPVRDGPLIAGVSAFGLSGTNAHVVLEGPPVVSRPVFDNRDENRLTILPLSARSPIALRSLVERYIAFLEGPAGADAPSEGLAFTAACGRAHFSHRLAVVGSTAGEWLTTLRAHRDQPDVTDSPPRVAAPGIVMVFSGQGPHWWGMGRELLATEPVFRSAVERCALAFERYAPWRLLEELSRDEAHSRLGDTEIAQPCLFALQLGVVALWRAWGIQPAAVVGHSVGEIAAAQAAGALSLDDACRLVALRGRLLQRSAGQGAMAVASLSEAEMATMAADFEGIEIAAVNSPRMTTITGAAAAVGAAVAVMRGRGVTCQELRGGYAFHSAQMEPHAAELAEALGSIEAWTPSVLIMSTVTGDIAPTLAAPYWAEQLRRPVQFQPAITRLLERGYTAFLEVGPDAVLLPAIADTAETAGQPVLLASSLRRRQPERDSMIRALGRLYEAGLTVEWTGVYPSGQVISDAPTYPFERRSYWVPQDRERHRRIAPLLDRVTRLPHSDLYLFELDLDLNDATLSYFAEHRVFEEVWFPAAGFLELACQAAQHLHGASVIALENVRFSRALVVGPDEPRVVQLILESDGDDTRRFRIFSRGTGQTSAAIEHADGRVRLGAAAELSVRALPTLAVLQNRCQLTRTGSEVYAAKQAVGVEYGPSFRALVEESADEDYALGRLRPAAELADEGRSYIMHPSLLDAALQIVTSVAMKGRQKRGVRVPARLDRLEVGQQGGLAVWACARRSETADADLFMLDAQGHVVSAAIGLHLQSVGERAGFLPCLHDVVWKPEQSFSRSELRGQWLIFADASGIGRGLAVLLRAAGLRAHVVVRTSAEAAALQDDELACNASRSDHVDWLLDYVDEEAQPLTIVHLWSLDAPATSETTVDALDEAQEWGCFSVIHVAQALERRTHRHERRLFLITRGAQPARGEVVSVGQSPTWGAGAAIGRELPDVWTSMIDLDPRDAGPTQLFDELARGGRRRVALRNGERLLPHLVRRIPPADPLRYRLGLRSDRTYVIAGGTGGLGLIVAERLLERGAKYLALIGRRPPQPDAQRQIAALTARGADIHFVAADIAEPDQLASAMNELASRLPPISGVVHAAGVVDDAIVANVSAARARAVIAPKIRGSWNLHRWALDQPLEFFVLFSSTVGLFGAPGQIHYAAGNAFLDALAHARNAQGLVGQSIDWGGWLNVGMTARPGVSQSALRTSDDYLLDSSEGARLFDEVMAGTSSAQVVAMRSSTRWLEEDEVLVDDVDRSSPQHVLPAQKHTMSFSQALAQTPRDRREAVVRERLRDVVAQLLDRHPGDIRDDRRFDELGVDSLALIVLRRRLHEHMQVVVPAATFHEHQTLDALAAHVTHTLETATRPTDSAIEANPLVELTDGGVEPSMYLVHPVGGMVTCYGRLAHAMRRRVYGFEAIGLQAGCDLVDSIAGLASSYVQALRRHQPSGPYLLGGWSMGGCIAYEMARQIVTEGGEVALVALIDTHHPSLSATDAGSRLVRRAVLGVEDDQVPSGRAPDLEPEYEARARALRHFLWDYCAQRESSSKSPLDAHLVIERAIDRTATFTSSAATVKHAVANLQRQHLLGPMPEHDAARLLAVFEANLRAYRHYNPLPYGGRIVMIRCGNASVLEPDLGWGETARDLDVYVVDCDHYGAMRSPAVDEIAAALTNAIATCHQVTQT